MVASFLNIAKQCLPSDRYARLYAQMPNNLSLLRKYSTGGAILSGVGLVFNAFIRREYLSWANITMMAGLIGCLKAKEVISQNLKVEVASLTKRVASFHEELKKAGLGNIEKDLSGYINKCKPLGRDFNRLPKEEQTPYLKQVMGEIFRFFKTKDGKERKARFDTILAIHPPKPTPIPKEVGKIPTAAARVRYHNPKPVTKAPGIGNTPLFEGIGGLVRSIPRSIRGLVSYPPGHKATLPVDKREWRIKEGDKPDSLGRLIGANERARRAMARTTANAEREGRKEDDRDESFLEFFTDPKSLDDAHFAELPKNVSRPRIFQSYTRTREWSENIKGLATIDKASSETGTIGGYSFAVATHPGYKGRKGWLKAEENEDRCIADGFYVKGSPKAKIKYPVRVFGIADGHGGDASSEYIRIKLAEFFSEQVEKLNKETLEDVDIYNALVRTTLNINKFFYDKKTQSGAVLNFAIIMNNKLFVANVGDVRAMLVTPKGDIIQLSTDHTAENQKASIELRGGRIIDDYVDGIVQPGRTLGDTELNSHISARPSVSMKPLSEIPEGSLLLIGCDGVFDHGSTRGYGEGLLKCIKSKLSSLVYQVVGSAVIAQWKGSYNRKVDNTTAIIVRFPDPKTVFQSAIRA